MTFARSGLKQKEDAEWFVAWSVVNTFERISCMEQGPSCQGFLAWRTLKLHSRKVIRTYTCGPSKHTQILSRFLARPRLFVTVLRFFNTWNCHGHRVAASCVACLSQLGLDADTGWSWSSFSSRCLSLPLQVVWINHSLPVIQFYIIKKNHLQSTYYTQIQTIFVFLHI